MSSEHRQAYNVGCHNVNKIFDHKPYASFITLTNKCALEYNM